MTNTAELSGGARGTELSGRIGALIRITATTALLWSCGDSGSRATGPTQPSGPVAQFKELAAHAPCGLALSGAAYCWGDASWDRPSVAARVGGGYIFTAITSGGSHMCGLVEGGTAYCWGYNGGGALGTGDTTFSQFPVPVSGGLMFASISAGPGYTCGVTLDGAGYCWGADWVRFNAQLTPQPLGVGLTFRSISAGIRSHTCGITVSDEAHCWGGSNNVGELGNGDPGQHAQLTVPVSGGLRFASISAGSDHTCGVSTEGRAYCWGWNIWGALGIGSTDTLAHAVPEPVAGNLKFVDLSVGVTHTCGVTENGAVYCWGAGQLGNGKGEDRKTVPTLVQTSLTFASVASGWGYTCALTTDGSTYCWGLGSSVPLGIAAPR